ncbi:MAG: TIGR04282 family arsenosugar biosynthesis glycosyltransferase [Pseudomonadota bacterium]
MRSTVIVFVKAPQAGRVKTRLGADVGMGRAAALFRIMTERTVGEAMKGPWRTVLAVDPPRAVAGFETLWPSRLVRTPQARGDLGARMRHAFDIAPPGPVVIVGADAPGLRARHLREAFAALNGADALFGPAEDGGYWLIGLARRKAAPHLFNSVRWSTRHALADTLKTLPPSFRIQYLERLRDIDDAADLSVMSSRATAR